MDDCGSPSESQHGARAEDVHYVCQRCTACCRWPGDVRVEEEEIARIAGFSAWSRTSSSSASPACGATGRGCR